MKAAKVHYIHSLSYSARDKLVGAFVLIALLLVLGLFASKVKISKLFDSVVTYHAVMKNAQGITAETAINISGIDVGRVKSISLGENSEVHINFFIYKRFQALVRADSVGEISRLSLVGDNIIIIKAGSAKHAMLMDNALIPIQEPVVTNYLSITEITPAIKKITSMLGTLSEVFEIINPKTIQASSENVQKILVDLTKISDQLVEGKGTLGRMLYDKKQEQHVVNSLALLEKMLVEMSQRVGEIEPVIANANQIALESKRVVEDAIKLSAESQQLMVDARRTINKIDHQLNNLPVLFNSLQAVLQSTENTLDGTQPIHILIDNQIWPLSSKAEAKDKNMLIKATGLDE